MTAVMIEGVGFSERRHFDCTEQALEIALRFHGWELEEVLFDEWRFYYWGADAPGAGYAVSPGNPIDMVSKFREAGLGLVFEYRDTPEEAVEEIKHLVDHGCPVPIWVDPYYLTYYTKKARRHTVHSVVVVGYDDGTHGVHIVDPSPWQLFSGEMSMEDLKAALSSEHHQDRREKNSWVEFRHLDRLWRPSRTSLKGVLESNVKAMLSADGARTRMNGAGTIRGGLSGIRAFARDVAGWGKMGEQVVAHMAAGREQLQAVARRRYGHACYLASATRQLGGGRLKSLGAELEKVAEAWFLPANMLFKGSRRRPSEMAPRVAQRLADLADREEALLGQLREVAEAC